MRTPVGDVGVEFALDSWVMIELGARVTQVRCRRRPDLVQALIGLGVPEVEAEQIAAESWRERPSDASMVSDSASAIMSIGNQWVAAIAVAVVIGGFLLVFLMPHLLFG